jgi:riboflavin transporter FmnP
VALAAGTAARALVMIPANLVVLPFFLWFFVGGSTGFPLTLVLTVVTAFNLVSGLLTSLATFMVYKRVARFLESW